MTRTTPQIHGPTASFETEARSTLTTLQSALGAVIDALPGRVSRPSEVTHRLGIDRNLGWRITRAADAPDPFAMIEHLPGAGGLDIFVKAAAQSGVPEVTLATLRSACDGLHELIERHAGDRDSLVMMARAYADPSDTDPGLAHRREAFQGNSFIYGLQVRTQLSVSILAPSQASDKVDYAIVSGLIDLRRLRPNVSCLLSRMGFTDATTLAGRCPGDVSGIAPLPLLTPFCTDPLPKLHSQIDERGWLEIRLQSGPVGDRASMTMIFAGEAMRGVGSRCRTDQDPTADLNTRIRVPVATLVKDLLVQPALFGPIEPRATVYNELHGEVRSARMRDASCRLPVDCPVTYLGHGSGVVRCSDVPRYPEMIRHICNRHGWDAEEFEVYRVVMRYPILSSNAVLSFDLPE